MLTFREAQALLRRMTYKEGWLIELAEIHGEVSLRIESRELDATRKQPGRIAIYGVTQVPLEILDSEKFIRFVHRALQDREMHEVDEWFQVDGVAPFYPH